MLGIKLNATERAAAAAVKSRARQLARGGNTGDVHIRAVAGLRVYAARLSAAGDPKTGAAILKSADEAQGLLDAAAEIREQIAQPKTDHVGEAVAFAATELQKKLPCCFPSAADAVAFASRLPLIEARAAASLACDKGAKLTRRAGEKHHEAVRAVEIACLAAMGGFDDAAAVRKVAALA
jgi:hypothetical protein